MLLNTLHVSHWKIDLCDAIKYTSLMLLNTQFDAIKYTSRKPLKNWNGANFRCFGIWGHETVVVSGSSD